MYLCYLELLRRGRPALFDLIKAESYFSSPLVSGSFLILCLYLFVGCFFFFNSKTGFLSIASAILETGWPRTLRSDCLCVLSARIQGVCRHHPGKTRDIITGFYEYLGAKELAV